MSILWEKFKRYGIHKLGGKTPDEYDQAVIANRQQMQGQFERQKEEFFKKYENVISSIVRLRAEELQERDCVKFFLEVSKRMVIQYDTPDDIERLGQFVGDYFGKRLKQVGMSYLIFSPENRQLKR